MSNPTTLMIITAHFSDHDKITLEWNGTKNKLNEVKVYGN